VKARFTEPDISAEAERLGFCGTRFTRARLDEKVATRFDDFLADGFEGEMGWLRETRDRRESPEKMWPEAQTAILLAMHYGPDHDPLETLKQRAVGNISVYARNRDYHDLVKGRLKELAQKIASRNNCQVKVFVDTAPLLEKPLAQQAGLGWQGKHTNLVSRDHGSWFFLGVILTDDDFEPNAAETDLCGTCRACLDICPTAAFPAPYRLDARRCISYLTIEHASPIPTEFRQAMGNRIYGCDDCLAVCPWNKFAAKASEAKLQAREDLKAPPLNNLLALDDKAFRQMFSGSPVKRIGRDRFMRNVLIAAGNSGDTGLAKAIRPHLGDPSSLVRGAAIWALSQLVNGETFQELKTFHMVAERDSSVLSEWEKKDVG
jgi:epoxyqueuosine reductase